MELGLKGKVALVTGAGSQIGFGKNIAMNLAREGCDVIVNDIDLEGAKKTVAEVEALGRKAVAIKADVTKSAEVSDMVKAALEQFGRIDILVNNAGASTSPKPFFELTEAEWDADINNNLKGAWNCTRMVLPHMMERKSGKIVNISSGAGVTGAAMVAGYSAAKAGVINFTRSIAALAAPSGINVNSVSPGIAKTGLSKNPNPDMLEKIASNIPIRRITQTQDIANAVTFLVSDAASDIVGQTLSVDGGNVML